MITKEQVLTALRSGEYLQGHGALRKSVETIDGPIHYYCVWGVICDLAIKANPERFSWIDVTVSGDLSKTCAIKTSGIYSDQDDTFPLKEIERLVNLPVDTVFKFGNNKAWESTILNANDQRMSFDTIADVLEEQWNTSN